MVNLMLSPILRSNRVSKSGYIGQVMNVKKLTSYDETLHRKKVD